MDSRDRAERLYIVLMYLQKKGKEKTAPSININTGTIYCQCHSVCKVIGFDDITKEH